MLSWPLHFHIGKPENWSTKTPSTQKKKIQGEPLTFLYILNTIFNSKTEHDVHGWKYIEIQSKSTKRKLEWPPTKIYTDICEIVHMQSKIKIVSVFWGTQDNVPSKNSIFGLHGCFSLFFFFLNHSSHLLYFHQQFLYVFTTCFFFPSTLTYLLLISIIYFVMRVMFAYFSFIFSSTYNCFLCCWMSVCLFFPV